MIRKFAIALGTTALIGAAALAPTAASAHWHNHWHHGYGHGYGFGLGPVLVVNAPDCYLTKQKVWNGAFWTWQAVKVCD